MLPGNGGARSKRAIKLGWAHTKGLLLWRLWQFHFYQSPAMFLKMECFSIDEHWWFVCVSLATPVQPRSTSHNSVQGYVHRKTRSFCGEGDAGALQPKFQHSRCTFQLAKVSLFSQKSGKGARYLAKCAMSLLAYFHAKGTFWLGNKSLLSTLHFWKIFVTHKSLFNPYQHQERAPWRLSLVHF